MPARYILICDDDLTRSNFEEWFAADADERRPRHQVGAFRWFEVDRQVCRTLAELRDALEVDAGGPPHIVLIDDRLQSDRTRETVRSALMAVRMITTMFGADGPKCVLHTSDLKLNDIWTFCAMGGHNAIDKFRPQDRMPILWETLDGTCWAREPRIDLSTVEGNGRLLPYMEHPYWKHNARHDLPELAGIDDDDLEAVKRADNRLDKAKGRLQEAFGLERGADAREIVEAANAHGIAWVPVTYRHLLPETHQEHRPEPFKHRTPPPRSAT